MLNGDVLTDLDVTAQLALHEARGARGDARAHAGRGPVRVRARADARRRRGDRLRREAVARPDRHAQHLRRRSTCWSARCSSCSRPDEPASIERDVFPRLVGDGLYATSATATGSTSAPRSATCRGRFDILEGAVRTAVRARMGDGFCSSGRHRERRARDPSALVERGCRSASDARIGGRAVLEAGVTVGADTTIERAVVLRGARIGAAARCAAASSPPACVSATARTSRAWRCSARA